jgi:hypothetical protein
MRVVAATRKTTPSWYFGAHPRIITTTQRKNCSIAMWSGTPSAKQVEARQCRRCKRTTAPTCSRKNSAKCVAVGWACFTATQASNRRQQASMPRKCAQKLRARQHAPESAARGPSAWCVHHGIARHTLPRTASYRSEDTQARDRLPCPCAQGLRQLPLRNQPEHPHRISQPHTTEARSDRPESG